MFSKKPDPQKPSNIGNTTPSKPTGAPTAPPSPMSGNPTSLKAMP